MKDIETFIREKGAECEKRSVNWEEKVLACRERMNTAEDEEAVHAYELDYQKCIGKKNELLAVSDFCNELLSKYFN